MGVTWTLEFVQWVDSHMEKLPWLFLVIDVFNVLQAVATFVIFVCKRKIINQLEQKHPSLRCMLANKRQQAFKIYAGGMSYSCFKICKLFFILVKLLRVQF